HRPAGPGAARRRWRHGGSKSAIHGRRRTVVPCRPDLVDVSPAAPVMCCGFLLCAGGDHACPPSLRCAAGRRRGPGVRPPGDVRGRTPPDLRPLDGPDPCRWAYVVAVCAPFPKGTPVYRNEPETLAVLGNVPTLAERLEADPAADLATWRTEVDGRDNRSEQVLELTREQT